MQISGFGEFDIIEKIFKPGFDHLIPENVTGIGDDCAIIPINDKQSNLYTTDLLIEDIHFLRNSITAFELGFKSLAVNLSDIAAMGGKPEGSFLSVGLPPDLEILWIKAFMQGFRKLSEKEHVPLLGGDTTKSSCGIVINVCVRGTILHQQIKRRSAALPGDIIAVLDPLGNSAGGLQIILNHYPDHDCHANLLKQHLTPYPKIAEGRFLAGINKVHAMIDVSDGIGSDLKHIANASDVAAEVYLENIPLSTDLKELCRLHKLDPLKLAVSGGEDYTLLMTIDGPAFDEITMHYQKQFESYLYPIGCILEGEPSVVYKKNGEIVEQDADGFDHFA